MHAVANKLVASLLEDGAEEFLSDFVQRWHPTGVRAQNGWITVDWFRGLNPTGASSYYPSSDWIPIVADYLNWLDARFTFAPGHPNVTTWLIASKHSGWMAKYCLEKNDGRMLKLMRDYFNIH